jgi:hypothetical protein
MNTSLRVLMGIATLAILIPAVTLVASNRQSITSEASSPINDSSDQSAGLAASPITPQLDSNRTGTIGPIDDIRRPSTIAVPTTADGNAAKSTSSTSSGDAASTTTSEHDHDAPSSTAETETTEPSATAGTITGEACPCTVTGTATLKDEVRLQGDLIVDGGTLIARSGVNVDGNGFQIMIVNGGRADIQGTPTSTWSGDGSNANLTRDINFSNLRRIMFHEGAGKSTLRYFTVSDSGTSELGDYSIHFHLNGNSTRGTLVEGVAVLNSRHHAFVPHGSHGITFKDTIARNGRCEAYWWDQPEFQSTNQINNSNDVLYDHVLVDGVTNCADDGRGHRLSGIELGAGSGNVIRNSVVRNVRPSHSKDCSGYHWPELSAKQPSSWTFSNNASYGSACNGIFVWQNDNEDHIVNGFAGDGIDHGAYVNRFDYRNVNVDFIEVHAVGWSVTGGSADEVIALKHSLEGDPVNLKNISIGRFIVDNATNGGSTPATYSLEKVGLKCGDVEWRSVVPGTKVIVDGSDC